MFCFVVSLYFLVICFKNTHFFFDTHNFTHFCCFYFVWKHLICWILFEKNKAKENRLFCCVFPIHKMQQLLFSFVSLQEPMPYFDVCDFSLWQNPLFFFLKSKVLFCVAMVTMATFYLCGFILWLLLLLFSVTNPFVPCFVVWFIKCIVFRDFTYTDILKYFYIVMCELFAWKFFFVTNTSLMLYFVLSLLFRFKSCFSCLFCISQKKSAVCFYFCFLWITKSTKQHTFSAILFSLLFLRILNVTVVFVSERVFWFAFCVHVFKFTNKNKCVSFCVVDRKQNAFWKQKVKFCWCFYAHICKVWFAFVPFYKHFAYFETINKNKISLKTHSFFNFL